MESKMKDELDSVTVWKLKPGFTLTERDVEFYRRRDNVEGVIVVQQSDGKSEWYAAS